MDVVKLLVSFRHCDVRARDKDNNTPLHWAAIVGNTAVINVLIQHGADVKERGAFDRAALHYACQDGHAQCIHELMTHGADIEVRDSEDEATPLHLAARCNHSDCVKVLLEDYDA